MRSAAVLALLLAAGCGYQLSHPAMQPVRVAAVHNLTAQAELGGVFASALRGELDGRGHLASDGSAAPELQTELVSVRTLGVGLSAQGASLFRVEADLRLRLPGYEDAINGGEEYFAGVDVVGTEANRRAALRRLAGQLARQLVDRMEVSGTTAQSR